MDDLANRLWTLAANVPTADIKEAVSRIEHAVHYA
jgi:hypothetical protein